jgi:hypothetical protein
LDFDGNYEKPIPAQDLKVEETLKQENWHVCELLEGGVQKSSETEDVFYTEFDRPWGRNGMRNSHYALGPV